MTGGQKLIAIVVFVVLMWIWAEVWTWFVQSLSDFGVAILAGIMASLAAGYGLWRWLGVPLLKRIQDRRRHGLVEYLEPPRHRAGRHDLSGRGALRGADRGSLPEDRD